MIDWLAAQSQARPDGPALVFQSRTWSYAELDQQVDELCRRLACLHIPRGAYVAVHLPTSPEYVFLVYALMRLGLRLTPLNTRLTAEELAVQLEQFGRAWVICDGSEKVSGLSREALPVIRLDEIWEMPETSYITQPLDLNELQGVIFTSGTSGVPKGAMLTFGNHFWNALGSTARLGMLPSDRWLSPLPLYHVGGLAALFRCCLFGATLVLQAGFEAEAIQESLEDGQISLVSLVPTMLYRLLPQVDWTATRLRAILLGGAAAPQELLAQALLYKVPIALSYGLTETASQAATMLLEGVEKKPGSVGKGLLYTHLRIVDNQERGLPEGEIGEILVSGPTVMVGYYAAPDETRQALRGGWLHTGDLGYLDGEGDLWLVQRRSDLIVSGGENVYPVEVETVLRQHPAVADVCVVGVPDLEWGQQVMAMVELEVEQEMEEGELLAYCRSRLAGYKQPRRLIFVEALPQTASGKIDRRQVLKLLASPASDSLFPGNADENISPENQ
jgi:O-succinylbenzoic acid--CoA ligase